MFKKKKVEISEEELIQQQREKTAQQWIPICDIDNNIIYRKDGKLVGILRIQPENLDLLSDKEKKRKIESLTECLNGETEGFQIFCIGRPVDLNNYLEWLQEKVKMEQNFVRKTVLKGYINQTIQLVSSGEVIERRFYIIISSKNNKIELITRLNDLSSKLQQAELVCNICNDDEIIDVLSLFSNPIQASVEKVEVRYDLPSILQK